MAREYLKQASVPIQKRKAEVEATVRRMLDDIGATRDDAIEISIVRLDDLGGRGRRGAIGPAEVAQHRHGTSGLRGSAGSKDRRAGER